MVAKQNFEPTLKLVDFRVSDFKPWPGLHIVYIRPIVSIIHKYLRPGKRVLPMNEGCSFHQHFQ